MGSYYSSTSYSAIKSLIQIHCVRAHGRLFELLKDLSLTIPIVLHAWSGSVEMVKAIPGVAPGALFSFSGAITRMKPDRAIPIVRSVAVPIVHNRKIEKLINSSFYAVRSERSRMIALC